MTKIINITSEMFSFRKKKKIENVDNLVVSTCNTRINQFLFFLKKRMIISKPLSFDYNYRQLFSKIKGC